MGRSANRSRRRGGSFHSPAASNSFQSRSDPQPPSTTQFDVTASDPTPHHHEQLYASGSSELQDGAFPDRGFPERSPSNRQRDAQGRRSESFNQGTSDRRYHNQVDRRASTGSRQRWDDKDSHDQRWDEKDNHGGKGNHDRRWEGKDNHDRRWDEKGNEHANDQRWDDKDSASRGRRWDEKGSHQDKQAVNKDFERRGSRSNQEYTAYFASRARELKEEGNRMFQNKDYVKAMEHYDLALKITPQSHPDRAIFHSNKAACLMQMKPVEYQDAIHECDLALEVHPGFGRALLRRARAYEATGKLHLALLDLESLLQSDPSHADATEMAKRIRQSMLGSEAGSAEVQEEDEEEDAQGMPFCTPLTPPMASAENERDHDPRTPVPQENPQTPDQIPESLISRNIQPSHHDHHRDDNAPLTPLSTASCPSTPQILQSSPQPIEGRPQAHHLAPTIKEDHQSNNIADGGHCEEAVSTLCPSFQPPQTPPSSVLQTGNMKADEMAPFQQMYNDPFRRYSFSRSNVSSAKTESSERVIHQDNAQDTNPDTPPTITQMRPLKLIYDHDIRLAEMPVNCKFSDLRKIVKSTFPSAKSVLIKYRDIEGDLVTITSTKELRLAEAATAIVAANRTHRVMSVSMEPPIPSSQHQNYAVGLPVVDQLRLHVVEVPAEQEPYDKEEVVSMDIDESSVSRDNKVKSEILELKASVDESGSSKGKGEYDKWLVEFAELFRTHLGIDSNQHVPLHELGIDLCTEALEEIATTEQAHKLFELAVAKFRDAIALGYLHWGNVYMCTARKELPQDTDGEIDFCDRLQAAFDWAQEQYALAQEKFEQSLHVKPDFCDAMLSLGQKDFESAKLNWSLAIANQTDLNAWDSSTMLELFHSAEERLKKAAETLERRKSEEHAENSRDLQDAEHEEALKSQIYLLLGNVLYEHSQVEFRLGLPAWKELLDAAVQNYEVAGAGSSDIDVALRRHLSRLIDAESETTAKGISQANCEVALNAEGTGSIDSKENHSGQRSVGMEITAGQKNALRHLNSGEFGTLYRSKTMEVTGGDVLQSDESVGLCEKEEVTKVDVQLDFVKEENQGAYCCNGLRDIYKSKEEDLPMKSANEEATIDQGDGSNGNYIMVRQVP